MACFKSSYLDCQPQFLFEKDIVFDISLDKKIIYVEFKIENLNWINTIRIGNIYSNKIK